jgi:uncharacterized protein
MEIPMLCPSCKINLVMSERQGIEIDYCPQCRGVWLDRGELDKIIERSESTSVKPQDAQPVEQGGGLGSFAGGAAGGGLGAIAGSILKQASDQYRKRDDDDRYKQQSSQYGYKKKKSWLKDIFD